MLLKYIIIGVLVIVLACVAIAFILTVIADRSPIGYEDRDGWHEGEK